MTKRKTEAEKLRKKLQQTTDTLRAKGVPAQWDFFLSEVQKLAVYMRADDLGNVKCITCPSVYIINDPNIQGGHFITRAKKNGGLCFHPFNVQPQCAACNGPGKGKPVEFAAYLGPEKVRFLRDLESKELPFRTAGRHDSALMAEYLVTVIRPALRRQEQRLDRVLNPHNHPPTI